MNIHKSNLDTLINIKDYDSVMIVENSLSIDKRYLKNWRDSENVDRIFLAIKTSFYHYITLIRLPDMIFTDSSNNLNELSHNEYRTNLLNYLYKALSGLDRLNKYYGYYNIKDNTKLKELYESIKNQLDTINTEFSIVSEFFRDNKILTSYNNQIFENDLLTGNSENKGEITTESSDNNVNKNCLDHNDCVFQDESQFHNKNIRLIIGGGDIDGNEADYEDNLESSKDIISSEESNLIEEEPVCKENKLIEEATCDNKLIIKGNKVVFIPFKNNGDYEESDKETTVIYEEESEEEYEEYYNRKNNFYYEYCSSIRNFFFSAYNNFVDKLKNMGGVIYDWLF